MKKSVKKNPPPKRGGFLYWVIIGIFWGIIPGFFLVYLPTGIAVISGSSYLAILPITGLVLNILFVMRRHKKLMTMTEADYQAINDPVKVIPAPKRGGFLYWTFLILLLGILPGFFFVFIPICAAIEVNNMYLILIPISGLMLSIFLVVRKNKKLIAMPTKEYEERYKIITYYRSSNQSFNPSGNINDAVTSGQYFIPGTPGSLAFNPEINKH